MATDRKLGIPSKYAFFLNRTRAKRLRWSCSGLYKKMFTRQTFSDNFHVEECSAHWVWYCRKFNSCSPWRTWSQRRTTTSPYVEYREAERVVVDSIYDYLSLHLSKIPSSKELPHSLERRVSESKPRLGNRLCSPTRASTAVAETLKVAPLKVVGSWRSWNCGWLSIFTTFEMTGATDHLLWLQAANKVRAAVAVRLKFSSGLTLQTVTFLNFLSSEGYKFERQKLRELLKSKVLVVCKNDV